MVILRVLGMGCQKCHVLSERAEQAARDLGLDYRLDKITDIEEIARFGVMSTPALVIGDVVQIVGRVPTVAALREVLAAHLTSDARPTPESVPPPLGPRS